MLKDKLKTAIKAVGANNVKIAQYTNMSSKNIGKYTSGYRVPARGSLPSRKLVTGIYGYAEANDKLGVLCDTIGCDPTVGEKKIRKALLNWLYEDVIEYDYRTENFTRKIKELMSVVGATVQEVCAEVGTGISLLAEYCDGTKIPTRRSVFLTKVCTSLYLRAKENNDLGTVAELIGLPESELTDTDGAMLIKDWLLGKSEDSDIKAAEGIIRQMTSPKQPSDLPEFGTVATNEILHEDKIFYTGTAGLQRAVIRFLGNAAQKPGSDLLLYSDQKMDWLQTRFSLKWQSLMRECLRNGIKMKIIHNLDRNAEEMLFALQNWLPLYMTGAIEPYYRLDTNGSRFSHTVFISDTDCIDGFCTVGAEHDCVYRYSTDSEYNEHIRRSYELLMRHIKPVMHYERGSFEPQINYQYICDCGDIRIFIAVKHLVLFKRTEPQCSFTVKHPYLVRMFQKYAKQYGTKIYG